MSTAAVIAIVVAVVVVLAAVAFFTLARRSDVRGAGALSGETVQRDARRAARPRRPVAEPPPTGVRRRGRRHRRAHRHRIAADRPRRRDRAVDAARPRGDRCQSRRQFFNRATVTLMSTGIVTFAAAAFVAFLWPTGTGGFGGLVTVGKLPADQGRHQAGRRLLLRPRGPLLDHRIPGRGAARCRDSSTRSRSSSTMRQGITVLSQKCPHLGCRVPRVHDQPVVRVPVPRLAVQPRRREEGRPGTAWHGPLPGHDRARTATSRSTPATVSPAPRSVRTPPARRPRAPTAPAAESTDDSSSCRDDDHHDRRHRPGHHHRSGGSSTASSTSPAGARRSVRRSNSPPTASRTSTTRRWKARASSASS